VLFLLSHSLDLLHLRHREVLLRILHRLLWRIILLRQLRRNLCNIGRRHRRLLMMEVGLGWRMLPSMIVCHSSSSRVNMVLRRGYRIRVLRNRTILVVRLSSLTTRLGSLLRLASRAHRHNRWLRWRVFRGRFLGVFHLRLLVSSSSNGLHHSVQWRRVLYLNLHLQVSSLSIGNL